MYKIIQFNKNGGADGMPVPIRERVVPRDLLPMHGNVVQQELLQELVHPPVAQPLAQAAARLQRNANIQAQLSNANSQYDVELVQDMIGLGATIGRMRQHHTLTQKVLGEVAVVIDKEVGLIERLAQNMKKNAFGYVTGALDLALLGYLIKDGKIPVGGNSTVNNFNPVIHVQAPALPSSAPPTMDI